MDWKTAYEEVQSDPDNFEKWQDLIETTESLEGGLNKTSSLESIQSFRQTFDEFLQRFPMMQGFWVKYADWEFKLGFNNKALTVYERAVSFLPGCVDLWTRYCSFKTLISQDASAVRQLFQRAADAIGAHFLSHEFWDSYIDFERREADGQQENSLQHVFDVLDRVVRLPIHQYARFFAEFTKIAKQLPPEKIAPAWKITQFKAEYELDAEEGNVNTNLSPDYDLRVRVNYYHNEIYQNTQWQVSQRWQYESAIKRQHFEVTFVDEAQMVNWRKYLEFERIEEQGSASSNTILLYERALIPTALNEELWLNYLRYLISKGLSEQARSVFQRACLVIPVGRLQVRLMFGKFLEAQGELEQSKHVYETIIEKLGVVSLETVIAYTGFLMRHESLEQAVELLTNSINQAGPEESGFLISELAKITQRDAESGSKSAKTKRTKKSGASNDEGRSVFQQYAPSMAGSFVFWREYLKFEIQQNEDKELVAKVFEDAKASNLDQRQIKDLGHYCMEYALTKLDRDQAASTFFQIDKDIHRAAVLTL